MYLVIENMVTSGIFARMDRALAIALPSSTLAEVESTRLWALAEPRKRISCAHIPESGEIVSIVGISSQDRSISRVSGVVQNIENLYIGRAIRRYNLPVFLSEDRDLEPYICQAAVRMSVKNFYPFPEVQEELAWLEELLSPKGSEEDINLSEMRAIFTAKQLQELCQDWRQSTIAAALSLKPEAEQYFPVKIVNPEPERSGLAVLYLQEQQADGSFRCTIYVSDTRIRVEDTTRLFAAKEQNQKPLEIATILSVTVP